MYKSKAIIAAGIMLALAVFVVYEVTSVLSTGGDRYKDVPTPQAMQKAEKDGEGQPPLAQVEKKQAEQASETLPEKAEATADKVGEQAAQDVTKAADDAKKAVSEAVETVTDKTEQAAAVVTDKVASVAGDAQQKAATKPQVHIVKAVGLTYSPMIVEINPGDTVAWEDMSSHDTQALKGLIPDGAEYWHSPLSENYQRTFTKQGIYVYKCTPHFGAGMGGVIIVGKPVNLDAIKAAKVNGAAKRLVKKAIAAAEKL